MVEPAARSTEDFLTEAPCGGVDPTATPTAYEAGQEITLFWTVSQSHGNQFRVAFSAANELGFDASVLGTRPDVDGQTEYEQPVTLPMCTCDPCTLQLAQLTVTGNAGYYSCADIVLEPPAGLEVGACPIVDDGGGTGTGVTSSTSGNASATGDDASSGVFDDGTRSTSASGATTGAPASEQSDEGCACGPAGRAGAWVLVGFIALLRRRRGPCLQRRSREPQGQTRDGASTAISTSNCTRTRCSRRLPATNRRTRPCRPRVRSACRRSCTSRIRSSDHRCCCHN